jgi:hypothetical protein
MKNALSRSSTCTTAPVRLGIVYEKRPVQTCCPRKATTTPSLYLYIYIYTGGVRNPLNGAKDRQCQARGGGIGPEIVGFRPFSGRTLAQKARESAPAGAQLDLHRLYHAAPDANSIRPCRVTPQASSFFSSPIYIYIYVYIVPPVHRGKCGFTA